MLSEEKVFQRTLAGWDEVRQKTHTLTQSERLVLIVIDGVASCAGLRQKLKGLPEERFGRALLNLVSKGLVVEAVAALAVSQSESLDVNSVDRFVRQDPQDPVTVIPAEAQVGARAQPQVGFDGQPEKSTTTAVGKARMAGVDIYLPLESASNRFDIANPVERRRPPTALDLNSETAVPPRFRRVLVYLLTPAALFFIVVLAILQIRQ